MLLKSDLPVADVSEMMGIWADTSARLQAQGFVGLFNHLDERLQEFDGILTAAEDWGRRPHSPLQWWQWLLMIGILVISIAALVVCLIWFGCSWIEAVFIVFCAGQLATGGWAAGICLGFTF